MWKTNSPNNRATSRNFEMQFWENCHFCVTDIENEWTRCMTWKFRSSFLYIRLNSMKKISSLIVCINRKKYLQYSKKIFRIHIKKLKVAQNPANACFLKIDGIFFISPNVAPLELALLLMLLLPLLTPCSKQTRAMHEPLSRLLLLPCSLSKGVCTAYRCLCMVWARVARAWVRELTHKGQNLGYTVACEQR